jgi:hypothetical protein
MADAADRGVLDLADDDALPELADRPDAAPDRERHRLRPAGGEHDLVGLCTDRSGDHRARPVEDPPRGPRGAVDPERIA